MLIVISRVTSATVRTSRPRLRHASRASSARSPGACEPMSGGTCISSGASTSARPAEPGVPALAGVGVLARPLRDLVVAAGRVVLVERERAALGERLVVGAHRVDLVAVALQLEVAQDRRRHQAHHVGEPGDPQVRMLRPGGLGGGRAAGGGARLEDQGPGAGPGQVGRSRPARCARRRRRLRRTAVPRVLLLREFLTDCSVEVRWYGAAKPTRAEPRSWRAVTTSSPEGRQQSDVRRDQMLVAAAELIAERGFARHPDRRRGGPGQHQPGAGHLLLRDQGRAADRRAAALRGGVLPGRPRSCWTSPARSTSGSRSWST